MLTDGGDIVNVGAIRPAGHAIEAQVYDRDFEGVPEYLPQKQWRAYSWNGKRFAQSGGPTAFPPNPWITDLTVTGGELRLRPGTGDELTGTVTLTVRNKGPVPAKEPDLEVGLPDGYTVTSVTGCTTQPPTGRKTLGCGLRRIGVGESRTVTVSVRAPADVGTGTVGQYTASVGWKSLPEPNFDRSDNSIERPIVR